MCVGGGGMDKAHNWGELAHSLSPFGDATETRMYVQLLDLFVLKGAAGLCAIRGVNAQTCIFVLAL